MCATWPGELDFARKNRMSEQTRTSPATPSEPVADLPDHIPEELIPVYDYWQRNRSKILTVASLAVIVVAGGVMYDRHRTQQYQTASAALATAESLESVESLTSRYGRTTLGPILRLKLAKAQFDAGRYEEALSTYDAFLRRDDKHDMADVARLGRAQCMEALSRAAEARGAYAAFATADPKHYLAPSAMLGEARCFALEGDKVRAKQCLERVMLAHAGTQWEEAARKLQGVIDRFEGIKGSSLFDQLGAAAAATNAAALMPAPFAPRTAPATTAPAPPPPAVAPAATPPAASTSAPAAAAAKPAP
jgi:predicted negative regulator of RcsB-dependent stress response